MKNLKRVLSLVLATVMVIGMMVVGASAANYNDFTDKGEIVNAEAVALLNDLGIIEGVGDGSYAPTATIDRAGMAKLITKIMMGNVPASAFEGTSAELTDINGHWAEGYIKYCYSMGYIAGNGDGTFNPNGTITVVGAAKLLATALGYDAVKQGYVNSGDWSVSVMRDATASGLLNGINASAQAPLTRDMAAQMIYNALFAKQVYYLTLTDNTVLYKNNTLGLASYGLVKITGVVTSVNDKTTTLANRTYDYANNDAIATPGNYKIPGDWKTVGSKVNVYAQYTTKATTGAFQTSFAADKFVKVYSTAVEVVDTDLATVTNTTSLTNMTDRTKSAYVANLDGAMNTINVYVNGSAVAAIANKGAFDAAYTDNGIVRTLKDNDGDGAIDTIVVTVPTTAKVTNVSAINELLYVVDTTAAGDPYSISDIYDFDDVVGYEGLEKGDYITGVLFGGKLYVENTDSFVGSVSKYVSKTDTYTIAGGEYKIAARNYGGFDLDVEDVDLTVYTDVNGYVVAVEEAATATDYLYVEAVGTNLLADQAKVVLTDGKAKLITFDDTDVTGVAKAGGVYTYYVDDGVYVLGDVATFDDSVWDAGYTTTFTNGANSFSIGGIGKAVIRLTINTIMVDVENHKVWTGYKDMPSMDVDDAFFVLNSTNNKLAEVVFMKGVDAQDIVADDTFFVYDDAHYVQIDVDGVAYVKIPVIRGGEMVDLVIKKTEWTSDIKDKGQALYQIDTVDGKGRVKTLSVFDNAPKEVYEFDGTTLVTGDDFADEYIVDEDTKFFVIDSVRGTAKPAVAEQISVNGDSITNDGSFVIVTTVAGTPNTAEIVYIVI